MSPVAGWTLGFFSGLGLGAALVIFALKFITR